jgi:hypothetical protein
MNGTMVASGTKPVSPVVSSIQDIPLGKIRESKTNPRRLFDEAKLAELADFVPGNKQPLCGQASYVAFGLKDAMSGDWTPRLSPIPQR